MKRPFLRHIQVDGPISSNSAVLIFGLVGQNLALGRTSVDRSNLKRKTLQWKNTISVKAIFDN